MPCPHNQISIVQRSNRQSAVAAAAYQSGEKLFCEYDQEIKHYPEKRGIVLSFKLDAPSPCRLDAPDLDLICYASADCLHQHLQVI